MEARGIAMATKKKKQKSSLGKNLVVLLLFIVVIGGFVYMRMGDGLLKNKDISKETEYEHLAKKDILANYPASPKEVLKLYQRYTKALYTEKLADEQINILTKQLRLLLDEELLQKNPLEEHLVSLKSEIASYKEQKKKITNYVVKTDDLKEWEKGDEKYVSLVSTLGIKEGSTNDVVAQKYTLRLDDDGRWKVISFTRIEK